jgi:hypothetical protein
MRESVFIQSGRKVAAVVIRVDLESARAEIRAMSARETRGA